MSPRGAGGVTAVVLMLLLSGCGVFEKDSPEDDAQSFAKALSAGDLSAVRFSGRSGADAQKWWAGAREGMGESEHDAEVTTVGDPEDDRATARLRHTWTLEGADEPEWSYDTTFDLVRGEDAWAVELTPGAVVAHLADGERLDLSTVAPERGDIVGAGGEPLVTERSVVRLGIDKTQVPADRSVASAQKLARLLDIDPGAFADRVEAAGEKAFVEAIVLRKDDVPRQVAAGYESIPGARAIADEMPLAPTREFARSVLGSVGPVTAEMIEKSEGEYTVGDVAGLSGLEQRYDERLRGEPGKVVSAVDEQSEKKRVLHRTRPEDGKALRTTLDVDLQISAEQALAGVGPASALVAVRPSTGELLAAATGPGSEGYATATVGQYAPGSTFKVVTSLALLRTGVAPADTVSCTKSIVVDGKEFTNYDDYPPSSLGDITLREALAQSCNTAFVSQHERLTPARLAQAAESLGVGKDHDVGFPAYFGSVPTEGSGTEHAASLIGQGRVLASPMAMAVVAGSVAAGTTVVPHLLEDAQPEPDPAVPLSRGEAQQLSELMAAVVDGGSGALLADVPGPSPLAKTGTAEFGQADPPETHTWMIASQGDLAVAVFVEVGESGSRTAGPILEEFLRRAD